MNAPKFEGRDLSFAPITKAPKTLTPEQVEFYNENGYLTPFDVFSDVEAEQNRAYFDKLLEQVLAGDFKMGSYAINGYHTRLKSLYELVLNERILDIVEDIVGPNFVAWGTHFFCKLPGDPKHVSWHQDASYWPFTPARTVTVWLAIDDTDQENSAMMFLPKTHTMGHLPYEKPKADAVLWQELVNVEKYGDPVFNVLKAGQLSVHDDMLAHGSLPNTSDRRRCGLTIRYCPVDVTAVDPGWAKNAILCRGSDNTGSWEYPPKPATDEIVKDAPKPKVIGAN